LEGGWREEVGGGTGRCQPAGSIESRTSEKDECSAIRHAAIAPVHYMFPETYYPTLIRPRCTNEWKTCAVRVIRNPGSSSAGVDKRTVSSFDLVHNRFLAFRSRCLSSHLSTDQNQIDSVVV